MNKWTRTTVCFILNEACSEWIFHTPAVCLCWDLTGDSIPDLRCMNVGLNIHQMLSQKLYPLLSAAHKGANKAPTQTKGAQPGGWTSAPGLLAVCWNYFSCSAVMFEGDAMSWGCMAEGGVRGGGGQHRSILYISTIHLLYFYSLQVPPQPLSPPGGPHPLLFARSECRWGCLHDSCEEARGDLFDACFIIHVLIIQSLTHLPGEGCCSTLPSTHN